MATWIGGADQRAGRGDQRRSPTPQQRDHGEQDQKAHQGPGADVLAVGGRPATR